MGFEGYLLIQYVVVNTFVNISHNMFVLLYGWENDLQVHDFSCTTTWEYVDYSEWCGSLIRMWELALAHIPYSYTHMYMERDIYMKST